MGYRFPFSIKADCDRRELEDAIREVLEGPCAACCMDDPEDVATVVHEVGRLFLSKCEQFTEDDFR